MRGGRKHAADTLEAGAPPALSPSCRHGRLHSQSSSGLCGHMWGRGGGRESAISAQVSGPDLEGIHTLPHGGRSMPPALVLGWATRPGSGALQFGARSTAIALLMAGCGEWLRRSSWGPRRHWRMWSAERRASSRRTCGRLGDIDRQHLPLESDCGAIKLCWSWARPELMIRLGCTNLDLPDWAHCEYVECNAELCSSCVDIGNGPTAWSLELSFRLVAQARARCALLRARKIR